MAKTVNKVATIVGTIASIASLIPGPHQPFARAVAVVATVAATASAMAIKKPPAQGSATNVVIGSNLPTPYVMGRSFIGGNILHETSYGGTNNPYKSYAFEWSAAGPIEQIEAFQADFKTISFSGGNASGYFHDFLYLDTQLGATPEADALAGPFGAIPSWGAAYKMSGHAGGLITLVFDEDGVRFASGIPAFGVVLKGVKAYDPRLDSTYPGGSGAHRALTESTYAWTENPALHATTYALGRWQNGKKVFGCGFAYDAIDWPAWAEFANLCDANGWTVGGTIYEPGSKWDNLKRICAAGGGEPIFVGAKLSVKFNAPKVALDTISAVDLADGEYVVPAMKTWRDRKNSIIPRYRSEIHKWEFVQSDAVTVAEYVTEDGEEKQVEIQYDLVQDKDHAAQLAAYELVNAREFGPIVLPCKPRMIEYVPGEALLGGDDLDELGLAGQLLVITGRRVDPATGIVELTLESETTAKHAYALGQTGTAPPTPTIADSEELDAIVASGSAARVGLGNVDNTADLDKPISTATQTALDAKATETGGTFIPTLRFGGASTGIAYTTQTGRYTRIGRMVHIEIAIILSSKGALAGAATIAGLPFTAEDAPGAIGTVIAGNMVTVSMPCCAATQNTATLSLYDFAGSTFAALTNADFNNTSQLFISCTYPADT